MSQQRRRVQWGLPALTLVVGLAAGVPTGMQLERRTSGTPSSTELEQVVTVAANPSTTIPTPQTMQTSVLEVPATPPSTWPDPSRTKKQFRLNGELVSYEYLEKVQAAYCSELGSYHNLEDPTYGDYSNCCYMPVVMFRDKGRCQEEALDGQDFLDRPALVPTY